MTNKTNTITWITCGLALLWLLLTAGGALGAELLVTPQKDVDPAATGHNISINGSAPSFVPLKLTTNPHVECAGKCVILADLSQIANGTTIELWAVNAQGRVSDADPETEGDQPVPFVLSPKPSAPEGFLIVEE